MHIVTRRIIWKNIVNADIEKEDQIVTVINYSSDGLIVRKMGQETSATPLKQEVRWKV